MKSENDRYQEYFSDNPDFKDDYCEWFQQNK